jgi:hypothetical protein
VVADVGFSARQLARAGKPCYEAYGRFNQIDGGDPGSFALANNYQTPNSNLVS